jgi:predicted nucleic acid-binding protein
MAIASCLVDTNVLLRLSRRSDPHHEAVAGAVSRLAGQGTNLYFTHQNIAELWNVMTRPVARNGFGLSVNDAEEEVRAVESGNEPAARQRRCVSGMAKNCIST